ncbi:nucleotidyltransferase domain-containing protein [Methanobacterium formicicum]|uniref:Nucleotidyltransferase family protein n=1 Tax=Methanobacterium formicicum TaxID=2162 RepID=A0A843AK76_METFO|nr:nucleotidyltransferase family protein [Methanobacterium formicicum]MBF4475239.1 nucleotidyltransferase family protein [Methanobacterium formicicum]
MASNYNLKPEDQLLLNCSLTQISDGNIKKIKQLTAMDLDWNYLIQLADIHRLSPLLYWNLNEISPEAIPLHLKLGLQENFHRNVRKNLAMFKELLEVINILHEQDIVPIPYKGPVLAIMTYKNLGFRVFGDLDLYVPLKDVSQTSDILIKGGFEPWMELTSNQEKAFYKFQREHHFTNKKTDITIEIKWKFLSTLVSIQNEPFFHENEFLREVDLDQFKVKTISPPYLILILSIHNASHSFSSLYRFCDISELIKSEDNINWQHLLEIAVDLGVQRIFMVNLYILRELFGIQLSEDFLEQIDKDVENISKNIIRRFFTAKPMGILEKIIFHMKLREKRGDKLKTLLNLVFLPTPGVIESVSLPRFLEPVYHILRVFQMLKNIIHQ